MGRVECVAVEGFDLWFNSHDHRPQHFHALRRGEYELRIYFLLCTNEHLEYEVNWGRPPSAKVLEKLRELAVQNRAALLGE